MFGPMLGGLLTRGIRMGVSALDGGGSGKARRRRRKHLTMAQKADLLFIRESVGKTAAAQYLAMLR